MVRVLTASLAFGAFALAVFISAGWAISREAWSDRPARLLAAGALGFGLLAILSLDWMAISDRGLSAGWVAVAVAAALLPLAFRALRLGPPEPSGLTSADAGLALLLAGATAILSLLPSLVSGRPTFIGHNLDVLPYLAIEAYADSRTVLGPDPGGDAHEPYLRYVLGHNETGYATAFPLVSALLHAVVPIPAWTTFVVRLALLLALGTAGAYLFARTAGIGRSASLVAAAWIAVHPVRHVLGWETYAWQVSSWAVWPVCAAMLAHAARSGGRALVPAAVVLGAAYSIRPEELGPVAGFALGMFVWPWAGAAGVRKRLAAAAVLSVAANPIGFARALRNLWVVHAHIGNYAYEGSDPGGFLPWTSLFGLGWPIHGQLPAGLDKHPVFLALLVVLAVFCLGAAAAGWTRLLPLHRAGLAGLLAVVALQAGVARFGYGWNYGYMKLLASAAWVPVVLACAGGAAIAGERIRIATARSVARGAALSCLVLSALLTLAVARNRLRDPAWSAEVIELSQLGSVLPAGRPVTMPLPSRVDNRSYAPWAAFFLRDHPLFGEGIVCYSAWKNSPERAREAYLVVPVGTDPRSFGRERASRLWSNRSFAAYPPAASP